MNSRILAVITLLFFSASVCAQGSKKNPNFEFSGTEKFWKIMEILKLDKEPTSEQWEALFSTPGYAEIIRREFSPRLFQSLYRAAYMPSKRSNIEEYNKEASTQRYWNWFVPAMFDALEYADKNKDKIVEKIKSFETFPYTENAIEELLQYLPEKEVGAPPNVSFIIFNDSRGYDPVIMSINDLAKEEEELTPEKLEILKKQGFSKHRSHVLYFAHEFFHHFRGLKQEFEFPLRFTADYRIVWFINQIENEGIADLINVLQLYEEGCCFADSENAERNRKEQAAQPEAIRQFDEILSKIHDMPEKKSELAGEIGKAVTRSGHPMGYFMAKVILAQLGREALVHVVRNPFRFFVLYNQAAEKDGKAPVFSEKAIAFLMELESKYILEKKI